MPTTALSGTPAPGTARTAGAPQAPPVASDPRLLTLLQALADEKRLRILEALTEGEACVCDLQESLEMGQSLLSHHLKVLREAGLVSDRKDGRWIHYSVVPDAVREAEDGLASLRTASGRAGSGRGGRCAP